MNYRKATLYAQEDATTAKTQPIDIDIGDVISRIQVKFNSTNGANLPTEHPAKQISKMEVVDGSDVLFSLSAQQIEALMFLKYKKGRTYELEYRNGVENRMVLDVLWGRSLWDPILAFDPKKFKNPKINITHNKASGGSSPSAATLEVVADCFDEKPVAPIGFLMQKEHHSYTTGASYANEYIDLPNDYPIKRILLNTYKKDLWWDNIVSEVELDEENKKRLPWSHDGYDLMQYAMTEYGPYVESFVGTFPGADAYDWYVTPVEAASVIPSGIGYALPYAEQECTGGYQKLRTTSVLTFRAAVVGYIPHGCIPLDCGDQADHNDWFDVTKKGKVKLRIKAAGSTTFNTVLEQLRKY